MTVRKRFEWVANLPIEEQIAHYESCIADRKRYSKEPYDYTTSQYIWRTELEIANLKKQLELNNATRRNS